MPLPELQPGQYWRANREMPEGDRGREWSGAWEVGFSYLVKDLKVVDGRLHTVVLHPHPLSDYQHDTEMLARHFFAAFERDLDPDVSRAADMKALQERIGQINQEIADGPRLEDVSTAAQRRLIEAGTATPRPEAAGAGALSISETDIQKAQKRSGALLEVSKKKAAWLQQRVEAVGETASRIALFGREKAETALAQVKDVLRYAQHLEEGIETLGLYTGKDVQVQMLCDGPLASDDAPLSIFQRRLYMDEEFLVHLAEGGATWRDVESFGKALGEDETLLDRIIPSERGVVCMRYRRHEKQIDLGEFKTVAEAFSAGLKAQEEEARNRTTFLLIRDGRRVWQVWSEISTDNSPRLFPTMKEVDKPFVGWGWHGEEKQRIDLEDIRFSDKLEESRRIQLHYRRLLILLWGLDDRENLVGLRRSGDTRKFTDLSFQKDRFVFISDDDEERLLSTGRPSFRKFAAEHNAMLRSGSRVLCLWGNLLTSDTAPGCVKSIDRRSSHGPRDEVRLWPDNDTDILIARKDGDEIVVDVEASGEKRSWMYDRYETSGQTRRIKARVSLTAYREASIGFLVLDAIKAEDLKFYCESRLERQSYLHYLSTFIAARKHVETVREAEVESRDVLANGLKAAGLFDDERCAGVLDEAILAWRARNRGKALPGPLDPEWKAAATAIYGFCWIALGKDIDLEPIATDLAAKGGRKPLRLVLTGNNQVILYASSTANEMQDALGNWPWVTRIACRRLRKAPWLAVEGESFAILPARAADERVLTEWPEATKWIDLVDHDKIGPDGRRELVAWLRDAAAAAPQLIAPSRHLVETMLKEATELSRLNSKGMVRRPDVVIPFAIVRKKEVEFRQPDACRVLAMRIDAFWWCWRHGLAAETEEALRGRYSRPGTHVRQLRGENDPEGEDRAWSGDFEASLVSLSSKDVVRALDDGQSLPNLIDAHVYDSVPINEGHFEALQDILRDGRSNWMFGERFAYRKNRSKPAAWDFVLKIKDAWALAVPFSDSSRRPGKPAPKPEADDEAEQEDARPAEQDDEDDQDDGPAAQEDLNP